MTADQKQRANGLLSAWRATAYALHGDRMAALLQELVDAPEPKSCGWIRAIDEAMVTHHLGVADIADDYEAAKKKLNTLLCLNQDIGEYFSAKAPTPSVPDGDQPPPADAAMLASANRELSMRMAKVISALHKAPVPFADAIDNDKYLVSNVEAIVAELIGEQVRASELQAVVIGLRTLLDQVRHTLDLSPAASSMDILAEIENLSRLTDRAIQIGARDAVQGPYTIISDPRHATGIYETIEDARPHAESTARRSTSGRAAIVTIVAEVAMAPQWSDE